MSASLQALAAQLANGEATARQLVEASLATIRQTEPRINAFITVDAESALRAADASDLRRKNGTLRSRYDGIPYAAKDNFCTAGIRTTCASKLLEHFVPSYHAAAVERMEQAGFILIGKTNMDEFAMGSVTAAPVFGASRNPFDPACTCGGSSGGSAAAVAVGAVPVALGSDTGGSVRQPAAFCGVVGTKPTYGLISRWGLTEFAPSLDTVGIVTGTVADAAIVTELLSGWDERDMTSLSCVCPDLSVGLEDGVRGLRIGVIDDKGNEATVSKMLAVASDALRAGGAEVAPVDFPFRDQAAITYRILAYSEALSTLGRYDGLRYGNGAEGETPEEQAARARGAGFGFEVKRRLLFGAWMSTGENRERYWRAALAVREQIRAQFQALFGEYDILLRATAPFGAFRLDEGLTTQQGSDMDHSTVCESLAGLPAVSVPFGRDGRGMPLGVQVTANAQQEAMLLRVARYLEAEGTSSGV